jgi:hypothetical protein
MGCNVYVTVIEEVKNEDPGIIYRVSGHIPGSRLLGG